MRIYQNPKTKQKAEHDFDVERYLKDQQFSQKLAKLERILKEQDKRQTHQAWYGFVMFVIQMCLFLLILTL